MFLGCDRTSCNQFLLYINDICNSSSLLTFHLFADDSNLFYKNKCLNALESTINNELSNVYTWLCSNKLSLNIDKSNYIIFRSFKKKVHPITVNISNIPLKEVPHIKYLGVLLDSHLNWKAHISLLSSKLKRSIGILSKARHYTNIEILRNLYYTLIYPYLTYGTLFWGHTYKTTLLPLFILQKKAIRIISFSHFNDHTDPIFLRLSLLKLNDIVYFQTALFMFDFHTYNLPEIFNGYFDQVNQRHNYNTRLATRSTYTLPKPRTNYGLFNIKYVGPKVWNSIDEKLKHLSRNQFKKIIFENLLSSYNNL